MLIKLKANIPEIIVGVFLTVAVFAMGMLFSSQHPENNSPPNGSQHTAEANRVSKAADDRIADYTLALDVLTFVLAIATIGLGITGIIGIRLARDEFNATHRPKIIARAFHLLDPLEDGKEIGIVFIGQNTGDADGTVVEIRSATPALARNLPMPGDWSFPSKQEFKVSLASGEKELFPASGRVLMTGEPEAIRRGFMVLYCLGTITYLDGANRRRETGFCCRYYPPPGERWEKVEGEYEYAY